MEEIKLEVQLRPETGGRKVRQVRNQGFVPGVIYGRDKDPLPVKIDKKTFEQIRRAHVGESVVYHLDILEGDRKREDCPAIVKEEQHHPVSDELTHVDFQVISLTQEIEVNVSLLTKGEPVGVKQDRGSLDHHLWELDVICLPMNIPQHIDIDVSAMKIGDSIYVKDVVLPEGVRTEHDADAIVCTVVPPMREEAPAEEGAAAPTEPEVTKEKKAEAPEGKEPPAK